jgi:predicted DNA-binding protein (UPF0251 family)
MIQAAAEVAGASEAERTHWQQRVERARYEVDMARRQYHAVDPSNRLVARELERRFEQALGSLGVTQKEAEGRIAELQQPLGADDQARLRRCAHDVPALWNAPTTRPQDRKRIVRCLIRHVVVTVPEGSTTLKAEVHWAGGEITALDVEKGKSGVHRYVADEELIELVRQLATEFSDAQIARIMSRKGLKTPKGLCFTAHRVASTRLNNGIENGPPVPRTGEQIFSPERAAEVFGVTRQTVIRWVEQGLLKGSHVTEGAPWRIQVADEDRRRLTAADAPKSWLPLKGAALTLGVSQETVLQRLKSGRLEGVRVRVGGRTGWRIRIPDAVYDDRTPLFSGLRH